mgnify:CR=1 FL=1
MKRFHVIYLCLLALVAGGCMVEDYSEEIANYTRDVFDDSIFLDEAFMAFCYEKYDIDGPDGQPDGVLSFEELQQVRSMDCSGRTIRSLRGIEIFQNLDTLICSGNEIGSLTLDGIQQIKYLDCSGNRIAELNVSQTEISTLFCCPMTDPDTGRNTLQSLYVRRGQNLPFITSDRDKADPKRIPDETQIIAVPESKDEPF